MRPEDRDRAQIEAASRVVDEYMHKASSAPEGYLETLVNDTIYHERRRLERESSSDSKTRAELSFYQGVQRRLRHATLRDLRALLDEMARRFAEEIVGNFDERVYKIATTAVPTGLNLMLSAMSPKLLTSPGRLLGGLAEHIQVQGAIDHVLELDKQGTLVVVPTHSSHLDSLVLGYAVHLLGLPPLLYGAGLNLFNNPLVSFFMNNLGAYRVDRKKSAQLYKDVLKEYTSLSLELGYDNLFFPGGTRSRSGAVEQRLKKGLLGTAIGAYVENLRSAKNKPNIYIAPCTISYKLVLEAETLIDDHLKEVGKSRYIIDDDEFSKPRRVLNFMSEIVSLNGKIVLTFSEPMDVVGNRVDRKGNSLDPKGRVVDPASYVTRDGEPVRDPQRDREYTREVADEIVARFLQDNVIMSTHVVGYALFNLLRERNPGMDMYRLLHTGGAAPSYPLAEVARETERVLSALGRLNGKAPRLAADCQQKDVQAVVGDALSYFGTYHTQPALTRRGDRVFHQDRNLLLFYGNRLRGYDLGRTLSG